MNAEYIGTATRLRTPIKKVQYTDVIAASNGFLTRHDICVTVTFQLPAFCETDIDGRCYFMPYKTKSPEQIDVKT